MEIGKKRTHDEVPSDFKSTKFMNRSKEHGHSVRTTIDSGKER
jgi:hypothetical protein